MYRLKKKEGYYFLFMDAMNSSMGIAGILVICMVPLEPSSMETLAIVSWSGASTMLAKSYMPRVAYLKRTFTPKASRKLRNPSLS